MWQRLRFIAAFICLLAAGWIVVQAGLPDRAQFAIGVTPGQTPVAPEKGALAPPIATFDISNRRLSLADLRGQPVIVNFWATSCGPCVLEAPLLQSAYDSHHTEKLHVIGINTGEPLGDVLSWKARFGLTYDLVIDSDGKIASAYQLRGLPSTCFIGPDGVIREIVYGPLSDSTLQSILANLIPSS